MTQLQHEEREHHIEVILKSLIKDLLPATQKKIVETPYEPYNPEVILDLMGKYSIQRRTAKEWLICAQLRLVEVLKKNRKV